MNISRNIGGTALLAAMLLLAACSGTPEAVQEPQQTQETQETQQSQTPETEQPRETASSTPSEQPQDQEGLPPTAQEAAATVMTALKESDMSQLAAWVHPEKGIRFSPYAYVDTENDIVVTKDEVAGLMNDSTKRVWRTFAGSGELIDMSFADYYKQFVYDADFIKDGEIAVNKVIGKGTTLNNLTEVYPRDSYDFVEYHIAGIDPAVEGMDWRSLRLVFEKIGEDHALVGIIHDQWTP
ncbi:hypothetical protein [Paenibacillus rhizophilus]|uniref:Lipoprotein n=1 Tax=Paenibacillus rhizophilus TaxID=1850366 RepID=A0A3N9PDZ7_9BACL|nr:hypothetical protein [Paenibacillus rhizophilus]RQW13527.1 hypothetical protein EH198_03665 [Paenibacillus rhizophilus]